MEQRMKRIENNVERLSHAEKKHDFTIRDSAVKIGLAEGLAEATHKDINQLKLETLQIKAELRAYSEKTDSNFEDVEKRIDDMEEGFHKRIDSLEEGLFQKLNTLESLFKQALERGQ